jgi:cell wall-associated NlpC family hydrolase
MLLSAFERIAVIAEARSWIGTPYRPCAGVKGAGVDCAYLIMCVFNNVGLTKLALAQKYKPGLSMYRAGEKMYVSMLATAFDQVAGDPLPGDIALFQTDVGVRTSRLVHGGIVTFWPKVIHASNGQGAREQHVDMMPACLFDSTWRLKGWVS